MFQNKVIAIIAIGAVSLTAASCGFAIIKARNLERKKLEEQYATDMESKNKQLLEQLKSKNAILEQELEEINKKIESLKKNLVLKKYDSVNNDLKDALNQLFDKKQELIKTEKEFTQAFASVLDKMNAGWGDYVLLRFETLVNGVWETGGDFYRSELSPAPGSEGSWWFARRIGADYTIGADLSSLLYTSGDHGPFLIDQTHFSYHNVSRNSKWTHVNFPCNINQNYRIESWNGLTPIFSTEAYEQCNFVGLQKADLSSWRSLLGVNFEWQEKEVLGQQLGEMTNYRMSITARKPYYEELEIKRQELEKLLSLKKSLKEQVKTKSTQAIEAVKGSQSSDDIAQPEKIQELVDLIIKKQELVKRLGKRWGFRFLLKKNLKEEVDKSRQEIEAAKGSQSSDDIAQPEKIQELVELIHFIIYCNW